MQMILNSRSGADGVLHLDIPVTRADTEFEVNVSVRAKADDSQTDWRNWVAAMAGSWEGDFTRPPQGDYEERAPLS